MHLGLCQYALPTWVERNGVSEFIRLAAGLGLRAVEFDPLRVVGRSAFGADNVLREKGDGAFDSALLRPLREEIERLGLRVVVATGGTDPKHLRSTLLHAQTLHAKVVRTVLSRILCGERGKIEGGWRAHLEKSLANFRSVIADYERAGVALAVENHQDLDSDDLMRLCDQIGSDYFGVNLDTGNPLAVGEDPLAFARRVAPFVKNVHLKDYQILATPNGFTLFRCELGKGVLDVPVLLDLFRGRNLCVNLELAALQARPIRMSDADWQKEFPNRKPGEFARIVEWARARAVPVATDIRPPVERGAGKEEIAAYELKKVEESVKFLLPK